jgi:hypothetical protein
MSSIDPAEPSRMSTKFSFENGNFVGQRPKKNRVGYAEDCRAGADANGDRQRRRHREHGTPAQGPNGEGKIVKEHAAHPIHYA